MHGPFTFNTAPADKATIFTSYQKKPIPLLSRTTVCCSECPRIWLIRTSRNLCWFPILQMETTGVTETLGPVYQINGGISQNISILLGFVFHDYLSKSVLQRYWMEFVTFSQLLSIEKRKGKCWHILYVVTKQRWVVNVTARPPYRRAKALLLFSKGLDESLNPAGRDGDGKGNAPV
jgi:hypothetical protein